MQHKKGVTLLVAIFLFMLWGVTSVHAATLVPSVGVESVNRVSVTTGGGNFSFTNIEVAGLPPWEIDGVTVTDPAGTWDQWCCFDDWAVNYNYQTGTVYRFRDYNLNFLVDGEYTVNMIDREGVDYPSVSTSYTYSQVSPVDIATASPVHRSYVNTLTPTFTWQAATASTTVYYRMDIYRMEDDIPFYQSTITTDTTITVPATDPQTGRAVLENLNRYKWRVFTLDGESSQQSNNVSASNFNIFYLETTNTPPTLANCAAISRIRVGRNPQTRFSGEIQHTFPDDVTVQLKNPSDEVIQEIGTSGLDSSGWFGWSPDGTDLDAGEYTLEVLSLDDDTVYDSCTVSYDPNWDLAPVDNSLAPERESIHYTETPTFPWEPVAGASTYKFKIWDYTGGFFVYGSSYSADTTVTIPAGYLKKNSAYQARISAYDSKGNRADSGQNTFFIADDAEPAHISGSLSLGETQVKFGTLRVAAFRSQSMYAPGSYLGMTTADVNFDYTLYNMPRNTDIFVYAFWDANDDMERSIGELEGWHADTPIQLIQSMTSNVDITLDSEVAESSLSGTITIDNFEAGRGLIYIGVFQESDTYGEPAFVESITAPGEYTVTGLAEGVEYSVAAYWDVDDSGSGGPTPGDAEADYPGNSFITAAGVNTGIDISLTVGGVIRGRITDGNAPISNLHVYFTDTETFDYFGGTETDANGYYGYDLPPGIYSVNACPDCNGQAYVNETVNDITVEALGQVEVNFSLEIGGEICGTITDGTAGLANVFVDFIDPVTNDTIGWTNTDPYGGYCYRLPAGQYEVNACPGCVDLNFINQTYPDTVEVMQDQVTGNIDFQLEQGAQICGTITDGTTGLANIHVYFTDSLTDDYMEGTSTDSNGDYCFTLPEGSYNVHACPGCDGHNYINETYPDAVEVIRGQVTGNIDFQLEQGAQICGTITDGITGLANIHVYFTDSLTDDYMDGTSTDSNGDYCFSLPEGSYNVHACPNCDGSTYINKDYPSEVAVSLGNIVEDIDIELEQGGTICGATMAGDMFLYNIDVNFEDSKTHQPVGGTWTDNAGYYCYTLPPGTYTVSTCPSCTGNNLDNATYPSTVTVGLGEIVNGINLDHGGQACGTVTSGNSPLENIYVFFTDSTTLEDRGGVFTDAAGAYCHTMLPGSYTVQACPSCDGRYFVDEVYPSAVTVVQNDTVNSINLELEASDTDNDGLADWWETDLFGGPQGASDSSDYDNDGYSDLQEYLNQLAHKVDPEGNPFDPKKSNVPGGAGYVALSNSFWRLMTPVIVNASSGNK